MALPSMLLRHSKSAAPRISSPLATHSSSYRSEQAASSSSSSSSSGSGSGSGSGSEDERRSSEDSQDIDEDEDDEDLDKLLQKAKNAARARAAKASQSAAHDELVLDSDDLIDRDALPAIFIKPADPLELLADEIPKPKPAKLDFKGKGKARDTTDADGDASEILPGVRSTWGLFPKPKPSKAAKALQKEKSAGKGWFDMPRRATSTLTNEEKREIQALRLTNAMDPKRFMRGEAKRDNKKLPEFFQMGHIVDDESGPRAGLTAPSSKQKKQTFTEGVLADTKGRAWATRRYADLQEKAASGGKTHYKRKLQARKSGSSGKKNRR